jgi:hypothetical protein
MTKILRKNLKQDNNINQEWMSADRSDIDITAEILQFIILVTFLEP